MTEYELPDEAVYAIEAWARRNNITGETVEEREEIVDRICDAVQKSSDNDE